MKKEKKPSKTKKIITTAIRTINEASISAYAGQTSFFLMLSFLPFLLFCFCLLHLTPLTQNEFEAFLFLFVPKNFRSMLHSFLTDVYSQGNTGILSATVITALYLSSKAFYALIQGLNSMYHAKETRNFFILRGFSILYSLFFAVLVIVTLGFFVFGNRIFNQFLDLLPFHLDLLKNIFQLRGFFGFPLLLFLFILFYRTLPNCKYKFRQLVPGAAFVTVSWLLFSFFYAIYIDNFSNYATFYGAMTAIALLMVWLYTCIYFLFLGGIMNYFIANFLSPAKTESKEHIDLKI